jgi:hypothetical protein
VSDVGLLFDEHVGRLFREQLRQSAPHVRLFAVGHDIAPPLGTPDPDLLIWIEAHRCLLVTNNRSSMPLHLADHLAAGRHVPGILQLPRQPRIGRCSSTSG